MGSVGTDYFEHKTISPPMANARTTVIQMGERTHHHDHAMTFVSLRTMKTIVRRPAKPIPPDEEFDVLLMSLIIS